MPYSATVVDVEVDEEVVDVVDTSGVNATVVVGATVVVVVVVVVEVVVVGFGFGTLPSKLGRLSLYVTSSGSLTPFHTSTDSPSSTSDWKYSEICIGIRTQPCEAGSAGT